MDRKRTVEEAIHSGEMEGAYVSDEFRDDANEFVRGDMTIEQLMQRAWRRNNCANRAEPVRPFKEIEPFDNESDAMAFASDMALRMLDETR